MNNYLKNNNSLKNKKICYVILGHQINQKTFEPSNSCKLRCEVLANDINKYSFNDYFIIFMGLGRLQGQCELSISECMFNYFSKKYFIPSHFIIERQSLDTVGDAIFSYEIIKSIDFKNKIYIISSDWHMKRVKHIFREIYLDKTKLFFIESEELKFLNKEDKNNIYFNEKKSLDLFDTSFLNFNKKGKNFIDFLKNNHQSYKDII